MTAQHHELDLHWRLHPAASAPPQFDGAWTKRQTVRIGNTTVDTLSLAEHLRHACRHAARDEYRWLRSLVDVHRLVRNPAMQNAHGGALSSIEREALEVARSSVGLPDSAPLPSPLARGAERAVARAFRAQAGPEPTAEHVPPGAKLSGAVRRHLRECASPQDALGVVYGLALPAGGLGDLSQRRATTAVPRAAARRASYVAHRIRGWRTREQA